MEVLYYDINLCFQDGKLSKACQKKKGLFFCEKMCISKYINSLTYMENKECKMYNPLVQCLDSNCFSAGQQ